MNSFKNYFNELNKILSKDEKQRFFYILILLLFSSILESLGLLSIIPLINSLLTEESYLVSKMAIYFSISNAYAVYAIMLTVLFFYFFKFLISTYLVYKQKIFVSEVNSNITRKLFIEYIFKPFSFHVENNTSILIKNLQVELNHFFLFVEAFLLALAEFIILLVLVSTLIFLSPIGLIIFFFFSLIGFLFYRILFFKKALIWGNERKDLDTHISKIQLESFKGIKEIKHNNLEASITQYFSNLVSKKTLINAKHLTSLQVPRYLFELIIIFVVVFYLIVLKNLNIDSNEIISSIGVFGVAAIKIIPSISKIMNSLQAMNYNFPSISQLTKEFKKLNNFSNFESTPQNSILNFKKNIEIKISDFSYIKRKPIFKNFNLKLNKYEFLGISGESGKGKSTLLNLFSGLINDKGVKHFIDNSYCSNFQQYSGNIGYVSQSVFIFDESISFNISLDQKNLDFDFLEKYENTKLLSWVNENQLSYDTILGEDGSKISGGQKQRIGIARALYKSPEILILDEPTASLDINSTKEIFDIIKDLKGKISIILVSHNEKQFNTCDRIVHL